MAAETKLTHFLNKRKWIVPFLFGMMVFLLVIAIAALETKRIAYKDAFVNSKFAFSIGGELCAMFVAVMMTLSILPSNKRHNGYTRVFVTLLTIGCTVCFLDIVQMLSDGLPQFILINKILCVLVFGYEVAFLYFFWLYATYALWSKGKVIRILNIVLLVAVGVFVALPFVNFFYPLYFKIPEDTGVYERVNSFWICRIFLVLVVISVVTAVLLSKEPKRTKIIISVFIAIPVASLGAGGFSYGFSILYTSMMISLVLIYAFIFSDREKHLYSTNKELGLATNIQQHMLPSIFPAFPEHTEFDIYASMQPARQVGGDFYDFFLIDDDHLAFLVADVSDKGVPAALFMMASKIMVQNYAMENISPKEVLTRVNKRICSNNQSEMFVTIWLGILDLKTGILTASNAGHEKPIIKNPDGHFEMIKDVHGFVVGWDKDAVFQDYQIQLQKGSKIFVYTDGVPEASNQQGKLGREKTVEILRNFEDDSPTEILREMQKEISKFTGNSEQFDDVTMLCLEYKGADKDRKEFSYTYKAEIKNVPSMISPILDALKADDVDKKITYKVNLALEEVLTNVCSYAYGDEGGDIIIKSDISINPHEITIHIIDEGKEFNPLEAKDPDLEASAEDRKIGGLGIFITKNIMDEVSYLREDGKNVLTMKKSL